MPNPLLKNVRNSRPVAVLLVGLIAIALIGGSLMLDITGQSSADQYVLARWSWEGLRAYLWLEAALLAGVVAALGVYVISTGFAFIRAGQTGFSGALPRLPSRVSGGMGSVFVVLGAALVALSLTTLILLNSCRYMRLI
jgi:hypothetical protein